MAFLPRFLCALMLVAPGAVLAQTSPAQTVDSFFTARLGGASSGAPSGAELLGFSPYLAPELVCLLGAAQRYSEQYAKAMPGDKPPFVEGDLYSSHFEVPTAFHSEPPRIDGDLATVRVRFEFAAPEGTISWHDDVKVRHINRRRWQIEDIAYQGEFAFGNHGSLRDNLTTALKSPVAGSGWDPRELSSCEIPARKAVARKGASAKKGVAKKSATATKKAAPATKKAAPAKKLQPKK